MVRRLAELALDSRGEVDEGIASLLLRNLTRSDLKNFLFHLKQVLARRKVTVVLSGAEAPSLRGELGRRFPGKEVGVSHDDGLGGGLRILAGDELVDASVRGLVAEIIDRLGRQ